MFSVVESALGDRRRCGCINGYGETTEGREGAHVQFGGYNSEHLSLYVHATATAVCVCATRVFHLPWSPH